MLSPDGGGRNSIFPPLGGRCPSASPAKQEVRVMPFKKWSMPPGRLGPNQEQLPKRLRPLPYFRPAGIRNRLFGPGANVSAPTRARPAGVVPALPARILEPG